MIRMQMSIYFLKLGKDHKLNPWGKKLSFRINGELAVLICDSLFPDYLAADSVTESHVPLLPISNPDLGD